MSVSVKSVFMSVSVILMIFFDAHVKSDLLNENELRQLRLDNILSWY